MNIIREEKLPIGLLWREYSVEVNGALLTLTGLFTRDGDLVCSLESDMLMLALRIVTAGITQFEKRTPDSTVCSIGYSPQACKWYGWSHRAFVGFGMGDMIFEPDFNDDDTPYVKHGTMLIINMNQAKEAATAFAKDVS